MFTTTRSNYHFAIIVHTIIIVRYIIKYYNIQLYTIIILYTLLHVLIHQIYLRIHALWKITWIQSFQFINFRITQHESAKKCLHEISCCSILIKSMFSFNYTVYIYVSQFH